ncbi:MAG: 8-oxo-dGTP diphosphatase [Armatimonadota bacterium]|nr:8-oxo-dGTP diphosphatase [Armatimonadota bacterium]MDR7439258.1 8-oxo-dGTP diphosphatase [Armatimonadota bacterium]MDR7562035.1 8-oxo-dGTP diphosphatase [Armatimonadota bacterium]MDR7567813.1 8-oxo-dGTP diphosphatase [Armatimonadota bacterium]MDR7601138.1 8-oxo-dGTP diphosphatase [Armatimonadota bacterium]
MSIRAVLCYIVRDGEVLLLRKAAGLWGEGKWNAPGGKVLPGEDPREAAVRETYEETGLHVGALRHRGVLHFTFGEGALVDWIVDVYWTDACVGELRAGDEGELRWFPLHQLPYEEMWPDDRLWLPHLLAGRRFRGRFHFDGTAQHLLHYELHVEPEDPEGTA